MDLLQQAENAIQTFYHCEDPTERQKAHHWLLELQKSSEGWNVSWMLLDTQKSLEMQYYGVVILHFKIVHNIKDFPSEQIDELKNKFKQLLLTHSSGQKLIISKLCSVYSSYILQTAEDDFTLLACINDIENMFKVAAVDSQRIVLEFLTVLPSDFKALNLVSNQKIRMRKVLNDFISMILVMCSQVLQKENPSGIDKQCQNDTLICLLAWIEFNLSIVDAKEIIPLLFSKITDEDISSKVCEVLIEFVTAPSSYTAQQSVLEFLQHILQLEKLIERCIQVENEELLNNLCLLFSNFGETHCRTFLNTADTTYQHAMLNFVKVILQITSLKGNYPVDETCSELTFNFWYTLQDDLYSIDIDDVTSYQKQFCDAYLMLVDIFHVKCQYPPDEVYSKYNSDEKEMFRCYRIDIQDTMLYVYTLLGERCLDYFCKKMAQLLSDSSSTWQQYEAILHLLRGATESIDTEESTYLPNLITMLCQVPQHSKVLDSMFLFLGGLSEWLNSHPDQITNVLPFLLQGLLIQDTATSCSIALKDLCHECALLLTQESISEILKSCHKGLLSPKTSLKVVVRLFEIGGYVISALPTNEMNQQIEFLVSPLFQWLKGLLQQATVTTLTKKKLMHYLNCFYGFFRALDPFQELPVHPVALIFGQLIPLFRLLKPWCQFEEVALAASNCITKALEVAREKMSEHAHVIADVLAEFFVTQPYGCILDVSSVFIGMLGTEPECTDRLRNLHAFFTTSCIGMVENGQAKNHPDCMQSYMDLQTRILKTVPEFIYSNLEKQISLLKSSLVLLTYQEAPTIKSTCNFIVTYLNYACSYENGKQITETIGRDILIQTMLCIAGVSPRHTIDHFADILFSLTKNFITLLSVWLNELFATDGFPSANTTALQKDHFRKFIITGRNNKRKMKDAVKDFSLACRGLQGMAYVH